MRSITGFEQHAVIKMLDMSDGSIVRVLVAGKVDTQHQYTLVFIGGWCTELSAWEKMLLNACEDFNVVVFESREKNSSKLAIESKNDLTRVSLDFIETLDMLGIAGQHLVILASSWGTIICAELLAKQGLSPCLSVFLGPIGKLPAPGYLRPLLPFFPIPLLNACKPLAYAWIRYVNGKNIDMAEKAVTIVREADLRKWMRIADHVLNEEYWDRYSAISSPCLVLCSEDDKFHDLQETKKIIASMSHATVTHFQQVEELMSEKVIEQIRKHLKIV